MILVLESRIQRQEGAFPDSYSLAEWDSLVLSNPRSWLLGTMKEGSWTLVLVGKKKGLSDWGRALTQCWGWESALQCSEGGEGLSGTQCPC